jgi:hypothetical protein
LLWCFGKIECNADNAKCHSKGDSEMGGGDVAALRTGMDEEREPIVALAGNPEGKVAPRGQLALFS